MSQKKFTKTVNLAELTSADELVNGLEAQAAAEPNINHKNNVGKTLGAAIARRIDKLNALKTHQQIVDFMFELQDEVADAKYFKMVMIDIQNMNYFDAYKMMYDIYLKSVGLSVNGYVM